MINEWPIMRTGVSYETGHLFTVKGVNMDLLPHNTVLLRDDIGLDDELPRAIARYHHATIDEAYYSLQYQYTPNVDHYMNRIAAPFSPPRELLYSM